jgi:acetoin utilization protein AcuC
LWADLAGQIVPDHLPVASTDVLTALSWGGGGRRPPDPRLLTTLIDAPRPGPVNPDLRDRLTMLVRR